MGEVFVPEGERKVVGGKVMLKCFIKMINGNVENAVMGNWYNLRWFDSTCSVWFSTKNKIYGGIKYMEE
jgi:hypothetical protein